MPIRTRAAKRYAEAVAGLAAADGTWDRWRRDLEAVAGAVANPLLARGLESGRARPEDKRRMIDAALGGMVSPTAVNLLLVMARRGRLELVPDVVTWFGEIADRALGVQHVTITTAIPLTDAQRARLRGRFTTPDRTNGGQVELI